MTLYLHEIINLDDLHKYLNDGMISCRPHPTFDYHILNYTDRASFIPTSQWDETLSRCRGLIIDSYPSPQTQVASSGPRKFFNLAQVYDLTQPLPTPLAVRATHKFDGSLGVGYYLPNGTFQIATRGSFTSDMAHYANKKFVSRPTDINLADDHTFVYEICYPENRIVTDYKGESFMELLGIVDNRSGLITYRPPNVVRSETTSLKDAIDYVNNLSNNLSDEEGLVIDVYYENHLEHLKLKSDHYVRLHAAIFNLTSHKIYEDPSLVEHLPDEVQPWAYQVVEYINKTHNTIFSQAQNIFNNYSPVENTRREFASYAQSYKELAPILFALYDNNYDRASTSAYKLAKPPRLMYGDTIPTSNTD